APLRAPPADPGSHPLPERHPRPALRAGPDGPDRGEASPALDHALAGSRRPRLPRPQALGPHGGRGARGDRRRLRGLGEETYSSMISTFARGTTTRWPSCRLASRTRTWAPVGITWSSAGRAATVASIPK